MNPIVLSIGPLELRAFAAWLTLGTLASAAIILVVAARNGQPLLHWLDIGLAALVGATLGARLLHGALHAAHFAAHPGEILDFRAGGLDWHGALLGGLLAGLLMALWRRASLPLLTDTFAFVLPVAGMAAWQGCVEAACAYGLEVRTLADYPSWLVTESPDVLGTVAPRLNLPLLGTLLALVILVLVCISAIFGWLRGLRLWLALVLLGLGMAPLSVLRAEYVPIWFEHRADFVLDLAVALLGLALFAGTGLWQAARRGPLRTLGAEPSLAESPASSTIAAPAQGESAT